MLQARHVLEGQEVRGHRVDCEWVKEGSHSIASLHSKVLYVDHLPTGFRDLPQFRKLFASVVSPPYCQIAQKHGVLQNWGLVEFDTAEQAEATMEAVKGATLDEVPVRVQYCVPNVHAINIYMSFVNNPLDNRCDLLKKKKRIKITNANTGASARHYLTRVRQRTSTTS